MPCGGFLFFQAEDGIRDAQEARGLGDVYKRQRGNSAVRQDFGKTFSPRLRYKSVNSNAVSRAPIPAEMIEPVLVPAASWNTWWQGVPRYSSRMESARVETMPRIPPPSIASATCFRNGFMILIIVQTIFDSSPDQFSSCIRERY